MAGGNTGPFGILGNREGTPARRGFPDSRYQRRIDTHSAPGYGEVVTAVITEADRLGQTLSSGERSLMRRHFRNTSRYEWMFWDMGYRRESWPVLVR